MRELTDRIRIESKLLLLFHLLVLIWFSFEVFRNNINLAVIILLYSIGLVFAIIIKTNLLSSILYNSYPLIFWVVLIIIRAVLGRGNSTSEIIYGSTMLMIYLIFLNYQDYQVHQVHQVQDNILKKIIFVTVIGCYVITAMISLYYLNLDGDIIRRSASGLLSSSYYLNIYGTGVLNIGGWDYIYSLVGTTIILLSLINKENKKIINIFLAIVILLFIMVIIRASLTTALLLLFILLLLYYMPKKRKNKVFYVTFIIIISIVIFMTTENILSFLILNIDNTNYVYKLEQARSLYVGAIDFSEFYSRLNLTLNSLKTFISNPIIGVFGFVNYDYNVVSGHSQWIDDLARYGIVSQTFFYFGIYKVYRKIIIQDTDNKKVINLIFLYVFILGFLNPVLLIHIYLLVFIILPFSKSIRINN